MEDLTNGVTSQGNQLNLMDADDKKLESDSLLLLGIFPKEVWLMITDRLKDSDDLENASNASLFFRNIYFSKQTLFLFPKVWEIFEEKLNILGSQEYESREVAEYLTFCSSIDKPRYPRSYSEILNLRLTCKTWNKAIENLYHNRLLKVGGENDLFSWKTEEFHDQDDIRSFSHHFSSTHQSEDGNRSPFICRSVSILLRYKAYFDAKDLLEQYGHHIWFANISFEEYDGLTTPVYANIRDWLLLMPNLKTLRIKFHSIFTRNEDFASDELQIAVSRDHMPAFKNLQFLRTSFLPSVVFNSLLRRNNHVSILGMDRYCTNRDYHFWSTEMPNLEELNIHICNEEEFQLLEASQVNWPLKKLEVYFSYNLFIDWTRIFKLLNAKWSNSLKILKLPLPKAKNIVDERAILDGCTTMNLNLPNLQRLKITMSNMSSLDFLLPTRGSLEFLEITVFDDLDEMEGSKEVLEYQVGKKQQIEFVTYFKRLDHSNVWKLFPNLMEITVNQSLKTKKTSWNYTREKRKQDMVRVETKCSRN